jgi:hypothetical protein
VEVVRPGGGRPELRGFRGHRRVDRSVLGVASAVEAPGVGVYRGRHAVKAFGHEFVEQWHEYRLEVVGLRDSRTPP